MVLRRSNKRFYLRCGTSLVFKYFQSTSTTTFNSRPFIPLKNIKDGVLKY